MVLDPYKKHLHKMKKNKKTISKKVKPRKRKRKKSSFPIGIIIYSLIISCGAWFGINHLDEIESFVNKVDIGFLASSFAQEDKQEKKALPKGSEREVNAVQPKSELTPITNIPVKKDINYFKMLEEKEVVLKDKEESLKKLESNLQQQKEEILVKIQELEQLRADISLSLSEKVDTDKKTVDKLVQVYANMKPKAAAPVLADMNEELAVKILHNMKKKNAAAILNVIDGARAKDLTEKIAGYRE